MVKKHVFKKFIFIATLACLSLTLSGCANDDYAIEKKY